MNVISARMAVACLMLKNRMVDAWRHRDERGLTTVEMAVLAVGLVIAAGALVTVIIAVIRSQTAELRRHT